MAGEKWGQNHLHEIQIVSGDGSSEFIKIATHSLAPCVEALSVNELWFALSPYSRDSGALVVLDSRRAPTLPETKEETRQYLGKRLAIAVKPLVVIEGVETRLRDKEHDLLNVLTCNANEYIESDELIATVWGSGYLVSRKRATNNLARHIQLIRDKLKTLEEPDPKSIIRSLFGYGYGFFDGTYPQKIT